MFDQPMLQFLGGASEEPGTEWGYARWIKDAK